MPYAEVLVDVNHRRLDQSYHYSFADHLGLQPGMRVLVPLQNRKVQGLVIGITTQPPQEVELERIRPVLDIIEKSVTIPPELIELAKWIAETTICSLAQSFRTVWPLLKGKVEEWVTPLAREEDPDVQAMKILDPAMFARLKVLYRSRRKGLPQSQFLQRAKLSKSELEQMLEQGWIEITNRFVSGWSASAKKQEPVAKAESEFLSSEESLLAEEPKYHDLTPDQKRATAEILKVLDQPQPGTVLLHGVTGSGKTELYREIVANALARGKDAIILVPEISLTNQLSSYFKSHFREKVIVLHSALSSTQKARGWDEILVGSKRIVIGARSAVFAPLPNLGLIVIDEEHDGAYKQDENPKYHARDVARKRMEQVNGVVILGSATPSLEAYAAAKAGKVELVSLPQRIGNRELPPVTIVDLRQELINGNRSVFSHLLQEKLKERLERGEQSMLFLNRRGYSTFVMCRECGETVQCPNCDVALTYHAQGQAMRCHYCNHTQAPPVVCPKCGSRYIRFFGLGTQRIEEELQTLFPEAAFLRMDSDTTRSANSHEEILAAFRRQEASILIGTQMMAKGLDFPNVTLVGVVAADQLLNFPDFRAHERTFQLLTQVAGRAGRGERKGEVVVQTYTPQDRAVLKAAHHDYLSFFWDELSYRRERSYPPFTHLIRIMLLHEKEERVIRAAQELGRILSIDKDKEGKNEVDILGPAPAVISRLNNKFRWHISLKGKDLNHLRTLTNNSVHHFYLNSFSSGINLNIEVDPLSL